MSTYVEDGIEYHSGFDCSHIPEGPRFIDNESTRKKIRFSGIDEEPKISKKATKTKAKRKKKKCKNGKQKKRK